MRAAKGELSELTVFGTDYDTPDGTCIRDYIHIVDLCDAHVLALQHLAAGGESRAYNLGNGQGYSVKEVIQMAERVSGMKVPVQFGPRRAGDPPRLVADASKIRKDWNWTPHFGALEKIIEHAWQWEKKDSAIKIVHHRIYSTRHSRSKIFALFLSLLIHAISGKNGVGAQLAYPYITMA